MKLLYIVRHAKSSWANPGQADFDRPLNERGKQDAPLMGRWLKKLKVCPDIVAVSTAERTRQTAQLLLEAMSCAPATLQYLDHLYHALPVQIEAVVRAFPQTVQTAMVVAHNPGVTEFVNDMNELFRVDNMPTCGIAGIRVEADDWRHFASAAKEIFLFEYPKKLT